MSAKNKQTNNLYSSLPWIKAASIAPDFCREPEIYWIKCSVWTICSIIPVVLPSWTFQPHQSWTSIGQLIGWDKRAQFTDFHVVSHQLRKRSIHFTGAGSGMDLAQFAVTLWTGSQGRCSDSCNEQHQSIQANTSFHVSLHPACGFRKMQLESCFPYK